MGACASGVTVYVFSRRSSNITSDSSILLFSVLMFSIDGFTGPLISIIVFDPFLLLVVLFILVWDTWAGVRLIVSLLSMFDPSTREKILTILFTGWALACVYKFFIRSGETLCFCRSLLLWDWFSVSCLLSGDSCLDALFYFYWTILTAWNSWNCYKTSYLC